MTGSGQGRHRRFVLLLAAVVAGLTVVPASPGGAAEGDSVSAHDVAVGLRKIQSIAVDASAYSGKDKAKAAELAGSIEGVWKTIEDTVRGNDKNTYIAFEDAFDRLGAAAKAGDPTKTGKAAHDVSTAVSGYLAKHPDVPTATPRAASAAASAPAPSGSAASTAPAPSPSASAAPSATPAPAAAPAGALARTGPHDPALAALAGAAFALGGLALILGARRRRLSATA